MKESQPINTFVKTTLVVLLFLVIGLAVTYHGLYSLTMDQPTSLSLWYQEGLNLMESLIQLAASAFQSLVLTLESLITQWNQSF